ncbi:MAG: type II secretion system protein [Thiogranum sp.]|nr:type II secretion system protein [Thiogranum sp.]
MLTNVGPQTVVPLQRQGGFTLVELVAVFVILATLSVLLIPRFAHTDATVPAQADQVGRVLRHAQALAMAQGRALTFDVLSGTSYAITDGVSAIRDPAGELQTYALQNGVAFTAGADIRFDSLGRPMNGASLISAAQSWVLGGSATVTVEPVTGFVSVTP